MSGRFAHVAASFVIVAALLFPIYWMASASLSPESQLFRSPSLAPVDPTLEHYQALFGERGFLIPIRNSLVVAAMTTLFAIPIATLCAYALARLRMRGRQALLATMLGVSMFPQISIVPPLYLAFRSLGLLDTYTSLVLPYLTFSTPLAIWMLTAFFRQLPLDLEDAAAIDGASRLRTLRDIVVPLAAPGIASSAILVFLYSWNEFLFAFSFTLGQDRHTVPVAIALFRGRYQIPWGEVLAAAIVATIPVMLVVLAFQRRIVAGLTAGATKG
jgi:ABC-type glycerol-3-phosphate transport system permease component